MAASERRCHRFGDLGFGEYKVGTVASDLGFHDLFLGDRLGASLFGLGACHANVGFGLVGPESCSDVLADFDVGDIDRDDGKGGLVVEASFENCPSDQVWVFQDGQVSFARSDRADDALADSGDDGLFGRTADELFEVGPDRYAGFDFEFDTVLGDSR